MTTLRSNIGRLSHGIFNTGASRRLSAGKAAADKVPAVEPSGVVRVLIVDDDEALRLLLAKVFASDGFCVCCAADGEAGWEAIQAETFDVLITDHEMPRLTGVELVRRVRTALPAMPVIMISGCLPWEQEDLPLLLEPGMAVEKPFSLMGLLKDVRRILAGTAEQGVERVPPRLVGQSQWSSTG